jgi:hypothetical protein
MILKKNADAAPRKSWRRPREPLDVHLTVRFKFGDEPGDAVTVINARKIPMVNSVFKSRDAIVRGFVTLLVKTGLAQPKVARELLPVLKLLRRSRR